MIRWHENLYMDSEVAKEPEKYMSEVDNDKIHIFQVYCVTVASNKKNLLDIIGSNELMFKHYRRNCIDVIGLAHSYKEAVTIVRAIVTEAYHETGGEGINEWIRNMFVERK